MTNQEQPYPEQRLLELSKEATIQPWTAETSGMDAIVRRPSGSYMTIGDSWYHPNHTADATLIAATRNALPALAAVVAAARALPLEGHYETRRQDGQGFPDDDGTCGECGEDWPCPSYTLKTKIDAFDSTHEKEL